MKKNTLYDLKNLKNKIVFLRVDYNVPFAENKILDNSRIVKSLPTIRFLVNAGARVVILSHFGRIKTLNDKKIYTLTPLALELSLLLNQKVKFINTTRGPKVEAAINKLTTGDIIMLENTRFEDIDKTGNVVNYESNNSEELAKYWASLADIFVDDAFGTAHRRHASNVGIATFANQSAIGFLIANELKFLSEAINNPKRPFIAILGGAKIADKTPLIEALLNNADKVIIGTALCYTFYLAQNKTIGNSPADLNHIEFAKNLLQQYHEKLYIAVDSLYSSEFKNMSFSIGDQIPEGKIGMDIGPQTIKDITKLIADAKTVFWNGPLGVTEFSNFENGTRSIAEEIANNQQLISIIGGGETVSAMEKFKLTTKFSHISTGGGAAAELVAGKSLPAIEAIQNQKITVIMNHTLSNWEQEKNQARRKIIIGNWKMNNGPQKALKFERQFRRYDQKNNSNIEIVIAPPFISLPFLGRNYLFKHPRYKLAAQHFFPGAGYGSYTGEISLAMLKEVNVEYVIIGHSERRKYFNQNDKQINKAVIAALKNNIIPIVAFGETELQHNKNQTLNVIEQQLAAAIKTINKTEIPKIIFAYEPIWAIGTGISASPKEAQQTIKYVRSILATWVGNKIADKIRIIYGGSVNRENIANFLNESDIDGALVGSSSLNAKEFAELCNNKNLVGK